MYGGGGAKGVPRRSRERELRDGDAAFLSHKELVSGPWMPCLTEGRGRGIGCRSVFGRRARRVLRGLRVVTWKAGVDAQFMRADDHFHCAAVRQVVVGAAAPRWQTAEAEDEEDDDNEEGWAREEPC